MELSKFGEKFSGQSGIVELMDDLGTALNENPNMLFMGGGNPGRIPEVEQVFKGASGTGFSGSGTASQPDGCLSVAPGRQGLSRADCRAVKQQFGWSLSARNIAVSNGSQSAFFVLYNMFAGEMPDGSHSLFICHWRRNISAIAI